MSASRVLGATVTVAEAGGRLTAPAKHHQASEGPCCAKTQALESSRVLGRTRAAAQPLPSAGVSRDPVVNGPTLIGCRVDWLEVAFQLDVSGETREQLATQVAVAEVAGAAEFEVAGLLLRLKRSRTTSVVYLENADLSARVDEAGAGGWPLVVQLRAVYLATHPIEDAITLVRRVARGFGEVHRERLRRIDVAADFTGFALAASDIACVRSRAGSKAFLPEAKDNDGARPALRLYSNAQQEVTGITVGAGGDVMARIYDKSAELAAPGREAKRAIEEARWRALGWDGSDVTRYESQFRGAALAEFKLRDDCLDRLPSMLDGLWQYGADWVRLVVPDSATRSERLKLDSRWAAVKAVTFTHEAAALSRSRKYRGGITARQAVGGLLTHSAARGELPRVQHITPDGEIVEAREFAASGSDAEAELLLRQVVAELAGAAAKGAAAEFADQLIRQHGARRALQVFADQVLARRARASSVDDATSGGES